MGLKMLLMPSMSLCVIHLHSLNPGGADAGVAGVVASGARLDVITCMQAEENHLSVN